MTRWAPVLLLGLCAPAWAAAGGSHLPIREIAFRGNDTTQPRTMLREMVVAVGDPADPDLIERSRQGIQDLGLFRSVEAATEPLDDGVRLIITVREKWYVIPFPRFSASAEGETAYGMQLRWSNLGGLNHTGRVFFQVKDEEKAGEGQEDSYVFSYGAPFIADSPYNLGFSLSRSRTPISDPPPGFSTYIEQVDAASFTLGHTFPVGAASQGWDLGAGVSWSNHRTEGTLTPGERGQATALVLFGGFHDIRDYIYSNEGVSFGMSVEGADDQLLSDYGYGRLVVRAARLAHIGNVAHQTLHLLGEVGAYYGGPDTGPPRDGAFSLGGGGSIRAYPSDFEEGDLLYRFGVEYLRPVIRDWLRVLVVAEAGNVFPDPGDVSFGRVYGSLGLGLRVRFTWFVDVEIEAGYAWPTTGGEPRFFASRV